MSWDTYVTNMSQQLVDDCAVCSKDDGSFWTRSSAFAMTQEEANCISEALKKKDKTIMGCGVKMGGKKMAVLLMDDEEEVMVMRGKETDNCKKTVVASCSGRALIIGSSNDESVQGSKIRDVVQKTRDHLKNSGY